MDSGIQQSRYYPRLSYTYGRTEHPHSQANEASQMKQSMTTKSIPERLEGEPDYRPASPAGVAAYVLKQLVAVMLLLPCGLLCSVLYFPCRIFFSRPPVVINPVADQSGTQDVLFELSLAGSDLPVFSDDEDQDGTVNALSIRCPDWLSCIFSETALTISGIPGNSDVGDNTVTLVATDPHPQWETLLIPPVIKPK